MFPSMYSRVCFRIFFEGGLGGGGGGGGGSANVYKSKGNLIVSRA